MKKASKSLPASAATIKVIGRIELPEEKKRPKMTVLEDWEQARQDEQEFWDAVDRGEVWIPGLTTAPIDEDEPVDEDSSAYLFERGGGKMRKVINGLK